MTEETVTISRHDLEAKLVKRCWENEEFRKEFTADPTGIFVKYLKVPAASLPRIVVHQETPRSWHIVLPARPDNASELSDAELELVAGGATPTWFIVSAGVVASVASAGISVSAPLTVKKDGW